MRFSASLLVDWYRNCCCDSVLNASLTEKLELHKNCPKNVVALIIKRFEPRRCANVTTFGSTTAMESTLTL